MEELGRIKEEQKQEIIEHVKDNTLYDYIASSYWKIEDDLLVNLLKECIYIIETNRDKKELIENIKEYL